MKPRSKKAIVCLVIVASVVVLVVAGFALKRPILEQWFLWKLDSIIEPERGIAAAKLAQMRSTRAVPKLVRIFLQDDPPPDYSVRALRHIGRPAEPFHRSLTSNASVTGARSLASSLTIRSSGPNRLLPARSSRMGWATTV